MIDAYMNGDKLVTQSQLMKQLFEPKYLDNSLKDINDITEPGLYCFIQGNQWRVLKNVKNVPNGGTAFALVLVMALKDQKYNEVQIWFETNTARIWHRSSHDSPVRNWENWKEI